MLAAASSTRTVKHWKWCTWDRKASAKNSNKWKVLAFIQKYKSLRIIFCLTGLEDRGLMLRCFPDVSPPSVCGIFRSGPSGTLQRFLLPLKSAEKTTPEDGGETSGKYCNISPRSSSPVSQNIIHNTGRESLNQFRETTDRDQLAFYKNKKKQRVEDCSVIFKLICKTVN